MILATAIVLAAGEGVRLSRPPNFTARGGTRVSKPLVEINSRPIFIYSLKVFDRHPLIRDIIVVANQKNLPAITAKVKQYRIKKVSRVVPGGRRRQDSVRRGLKRVDPGVRLVLIHDAARPFIDKDMVSSVIREAKKSGAAILGVPLKYTVKRVKGPGPRAKKGLSVKETIDRNDLWEIQTPQVFERDLICQAHHKFANQDSTDDAMLIEKMGREVSVVRGAYSNIKITTPEDLAIARAILKSQK
jgi:2-C-methyl-D-erythritol 4-phosphate cytidylyltransferase